MGIEDISKSTIITITNGYGTYSVSTNHSDVEVKEMLDLFKRLLQAAGYYIDGELIIVDEEDL